MQIVKNHYIPGKKVEKFKEIKSVASEMIKFLNGGLMSNGVVVNGHGLAHNQVEDKKPMSFFVLSDKAVEGQGWPSNIIINPQILEPERNINIGTKENPDMRSNIRTYPEACFSFPYKKPKNVERYFRIRVRYLIPEKAIFTGRVYLKGIDETLEGLKAHIFQHEWQHTIGENIYYKN